MDFNLIIEQFTQDLDGKVLLGQILDLCEERSREDRDLRFAKPSTGKDVNDVSSDDSI